MTEIEHYALSLILFWLGGFSIGVANVALEDGKAGTPKRCDLAFLLGFFIAIGYLFLSFKFVDGPHLIAVVALLVAASGHHAGRGVAVARGEVLVRGIILAAVMAMPGLYHLLLS